MSLLWDLVQQGQITDLYTLVKRISDLEANVSQLDLAVGETHQLLNQILEKLSQERPMDDYEEILALVSQTRSELYLKLGNPDKAAQERITTANHYLDAALVAACNGKYREAIRVFNKLQDLLVSGKMPDAPWPEIYVALAICHSRLGERHETEVAYRKAYDLEPNDQKLKEIAIRLGLITS